MLLLTSLAKELYNLKRIFTLFKFRDKNRTYRCPKSASVRGALSFSQVNIGGGSVSVDTGQVKVIELRMTTVGLCIRLPPSPSPTSRGGTEITIQDNWKSNLINEIRLLHTHWLTHCQWLLAYHCCHPPSALRLSNICLGLYLDGWPLWYVNFCW